MVAVKDEVVTGKNHQIMLSTWQLILPKGTIIHEFRVRVKIMKIGFLAPIGEKKPGKPGFFTLLGSIAPLMRSSDSGSVRSFSETRRSASWGGATKVRP
ncbi:MAG: hypothetical protein ABIT83_11515 [Massilia sp.]